MDPKVRSATPVPPAPKATAAHPALTVRLVRPARLASPVRGVCKALLGPLACPARKVRSAALARTVHPDLRANAAEAVSPVLAVPPANL